jgi:hypothetical protein
VSNSDGGAARIEQVVRGVAAAALAESGAAGVVVLADWTPEGELLYEWLVQELGETRIWRGASVTDNVDVSAALTAHPVNRTALLLGGRVPQADLLLLGDVWASQVELITGRWTAPPAVEALAAASGGVAVLDAALRRLVEERCGLDECGLAESAAAELWRMYEAGRYYRLRPRVVPKLTARTLGIDLFD